MATSILQVIAGVIRREATVGGHRIPQRLVEINAAVDQVRGADECVVGVAHLLAEGGIGAPAAHGQQGAHIGLITIAPGLGDVLLQAVDQLLHRGQIAHGTELIHLLADGMDDIVDALLDDHRVGTVGRHFMVEAVGAHKAVGFIGQATVLP